MGLFAKKKNTINTALSIPNDLRDDILAYTKNACHNVKNLSDRLSAIEGMSSHIISVGLGQSAMLMAGQFRTVLNNLEHDPVIGEIVEKVHAQVKEIFG